VEMFAKSHFGVSVRTHLNNCSCAGSAAFFIPLYPKRPLFLCVFVFTFYGTAHRYEMEFVYLRAAANTPSRMKYKKNHFIPAAQNVLTPLAPIAFVRTFFVSVLIWVKIEANDESRIPRIPLENWKHQSIKNETYVTSMKV
jgi:hypothetical protein